LQCVAVCCSVLQCVAVCCSVLQCVAVCCSVLQAHATQADLAAQVGCENHIRAINVVQIQGIRTAYHRTLYFSWHPATHFNTLFSISLCRLKTHRDALFTLADNLQHAATRCDTL